MLRILSIITLAFSFCFTLAFIMLKNKQILGFDAPWLLKFSQRPFNILILLTSLFSYRSICELPKTLFYSYILANTGVIICFYFDRYHLILMYGANNVTLATYLVFFSLCFISTIFGISRLLFRQGFLIDQNPEFVLILEHLGKSSVGFFGNLGRKLVGHMPPSPGSSGVDKHFALGLGTFCATSVAASGAVYMGYEAYQTRKINLRIAHSTEMASVAAEKSAEAVKQSAEAAKQSAFATQQKTDIKAVKYGVMSKEEYFTKYPKP